MEELLGVARLMFKDHCLLKSRLGDVCRWL